MLAEAGCRTASRSRVDIISRPEDQQNAQAYQQMLEKVGIKMTIRPSERVAWVQKTLAGDFEMGTFLSGVRPDPDLVLGYRFQTNGSGNYMGWTTRARQAARRRAHDLRRGEAPGRSTRRSRR